MCPLQGIFPFHFPILLNISPQERPALSKGLYGPWLRTTETHSEVVEQWWDCRHWKETNLQKTKSEASRYVNGSL